MSIIIGADFVPTKSNEALCAEGNVLGLFGEELLNIVMNADFRIFNLEVPLTDNQSPIKKCGPNLIAPVETVRIYKEANINLLTLANNHMLDQGVDGYYSTVRALRENGIDSVGGGDNLTNAAKPYYFNVFGKTIGVYACVEHEFSIAGIERPGANPFDPIYSLDQIQEAKCGCDYLIVLYHGGKEHYRYPSPNLQKVCRRIIEKGADLIICQHSHCIGCEEKYGDGVIVYGQGNFLFDYSEVECWKTGLLVSIDNQLSVSYIPLVKDAEKVRLANNKEAEEIMAGFNKRSEEINKSGFIEEKYHSFSEAMSESIYSSFSFYDSFFFRAINKLTGNHLRRMRNKIRFSQKKRLEMINRIDCEAWRELSLAVLENEHDI